MAKSLSQRGDFAVKLALGGMEGSGLAISLFLTSPAFPLRTALTVVLMTMA
jgi:hypothetical protein